MMQMQGWDHVILKCEVGNHTDVCRGRCTNGVGENDGVAEHFGVSDHQIEVFSLKNAAVRATEGHGDVDSNLILGVAFQHLTVSKHQLTMSLTHVAHVEGFTR